MYDYIIIGGGIIGLSVGMALTEKFSHSKIAILEKENELASHQTGHNSGVIHSGIYYKPGSLKARLAREGNRSMKTFCKNYHLDYEECGKVIVATSKTEVPLLNDLFQRGLRNGLKISKLTKERLLEIEPFVNGEEAIHVPMAGIVNYKEVCETMARIIRERGGDILLNTEVVNIQELATEVVAESNFQSLRGKMLINCGGLHSDRIAKMAGCQLNIKIVPFRGEYFQLAPEKRYLVKNLIYPVPNPNFPFLGVHFTRMIDGTIDVGPNAVLSLKREGYKKTSFSLRDTAEVLTYSGFWKLARAYRKEGTEEIIRSFFKKKFVEGVQNLIPNVGEKDLMPGPAGVRAQALKADGSLVEDFYILNGSRSIHICNAPSPAATASIEIGKEVVDRLASYRLVI
ncbi:L-2-hydroxyglutarate oxidase [Neobacillus sp. SM06]|uniref:L-2-hydroxyglutarate oxidase n=1 Tax=Neobacillus sp. SM06 TaxID=3422492 RepID=UPI003D27611C